MNENRNMILAIVLSALVLLGWTFLSDRLMPTPAPQAQKADANKPAAQPQPTPAAQPAHKVRPVSQVVGESPRVRIETPSLKGSINLKGARFDDLVLLNERQAI